jgi:hypothetical protein
MTQARNKAQHQEFMEIARKSGVSGATGDDYPRAMHDLFLSPDIQPGIRMAALQVEIESTVSDIELSGPADPVDLLKRYLGLLKQARTQITSR